MKLYSPRDWKDYELIDSGNGEKLERFGKYTLRRPEPQAVWMARQWRPVVENEVSVRRKRKLRQV